ncbi:cysteine desulfurase family protein [Spirosoma jeollabukense]
MELIYLDNNSTTRMDPEVLDSMMPYLLDFYGNASSAHGFGKIINDRVENARSQVADLVGCDSNEIIFTAGATESINLAIKGVAENDSSNRKHIVTIKTEHAAVLDVCHFMESCGYEVTYLPVDRDGLIQVDKLREVLRFDTLLVVVMLVNNETGVIQPIRQIADLAHEVGALFMTDATQAVGKMPINVDELEVDLLAFSAHKFYGPKGIGGLFLRQRSQWRVQLAATTHGGGHERGFRSGTLNVPGIIGIGQACELAQRMMVTDEQRVSKLRNLLETSLLEIDGAFVNGNISSRLYNVTNITFPRVNANVLIEQLKDLALSNGSACSSAVFEPSHVLKAMGLTDDEAFGAIRFSLGRYTTKEEINTAVRLINQAISLYHSSL